MNQQPQQPEIQTGQEIPVVYERIQTLNSGVAYAIRILSNHLNNAGVIETEEKTEGLKQDLIHAEKVKSHNINQARLRISQKEAQDAESRRSSALDALEKIYRQQEAAMVAVEKARNNVVNLDIDEQGEYLRRAA